MGNKRLSPFSTKHSKTLSTSEIVKAYDNSIVQIQALDNSQEILALGSGISIGNSLFLTNYHVLDIEGVKSYRIITNDKKVHAIDGIVKGDENRDLAIVKSNQLINLPSVKFGSFRNAVKGDKVVAIGNPYGLQNTVSEGIISGMHYLNELDVNIIQTTAPITHGSSGGA